MLIALYVSSPLLPAIFNKQYGSGTGWSGFLFRLPSRITCCAVTRELEKSFNDPHTDHIPEARKAGCILWKRASCPLPRKLSLGEMEGGRPVAPASPQPELVLFSGPGSHIAHSLGQSHGNPVSSFLEKDNNHWVWGLFEKHTLSCVPSVSLGRKALI